MTQYNTVNLILSNSQLNKLKSATKKESEITLRLSLSIIGNSNDGANFSHKLLLTDMQVANFPKAFAFPKSIYWLIQYKIIRNSTIKDSTIKWIYR